MATLSTALALCKAHSITTGQMELGLDCESAIKVITATDPPPAKAGHFDMIWECRHLLKRLPIQVKFRWIESHQDRKGRKLDWWAKQNVRMDSMAKQYWRKHRNNPRPAHQLQHERIAISVKNEKMARFDKTEVQEFVTKPGLQTYWKKKDKLTERGFNDTHWEASDQAIKEHPRGKRRWFAKHCTRWCGVARSMCLRKEWDHNLCPLCGAVEETTVHMMKCPHRGARDTWKIAIE